MPEVRRLLHLGGADGDVWRRHLHWLHWRQAHQARAQRGHTARRARQDGVACVASPRDPVVVIVAGTAPLTDIVWAQLTSLLPPQKPKTGRPARNHRRILEGMLWVMRSGTPWRLLPSSFGPWQTIYTRYQRWCKTGIWQQIVEILHPPRSMSLAPS